MDCHDEASLLWKETNEHVVRANYAAASINQIENEMEEMSPNLREEMALEAKQWAGMNTWHKILL